ncbi:hypothetical protein INR49_006404 [Caranx melampygus]|nr:hypothetical protein INR49_006404 [Caranx melampygus]
MELQPGKMTALVGPSGSGKTSCVSLLKRLYEPQEGQICWRRTTAPLPHTKYLHQKGGRGFPESPAVFWFSESIAIVRALVRGPTGIILDEATSKLDVEAQHAEVLSCGRTSCGGHQLKTVEKADHIIFMEKGEVGGGGDAPTAHAPRQDDTSGYY